MTNNMNKKLFGIIFLLVIWIILLMPKRVLAEDTSETNIFKYGDLNEDGDISNSDVLIILRHIANNLTKKNSSWQLKDDKLKRADVTKDNTVDNKDCLALLRYKAAKSSSKIATKHPDWLELLDKENKVIVPTDIILNKSKLEMKVGQKIQIIATIAPEDAEDQRVTWKSSNINIAQVDEYGIVLAAKPGECTINATTWNGKTKSCVVKVLENTSENNNSSSSNNTNESGNNSETGGSSVIVPTAVTLNKSKLEMKVGQKVKLIATVAPESSNNKSVTWQSSNTKVAIVDENGIILAVKEGECTIKVTTWKGKKKSCIVKVTESTSEDENTTNNTNSTSDGGSSGGGTTSGGSGGWSSGGGSSGGGSSGGGSSGSGDSSSGGSDSGDNGEGGSEAEAIKINPKVHTVYMGYGDKFTVESIPEGTTVDDIVWYVVAQPIKVSIEQDGSFIAYEEGSYEVRAYSKSDPERLKDYARINVERCPMESIVLEPQNLVLKYNNRNGRNYDTGIIKVKVSPEETTDKNVQLTVNQDNSDIIQIDKTLIWGNNEVTVTALKPGIAPVVARGVHQENKPILSKSPCYVIVRGIKATKKETVNMYNDPVDLTEHCGVIAFDDTNKTDISYCFANGKNEDDNFIIDGSIIKWKDNGGIRLGIIKKGSVEITAKTADGHYTTTITVEYEGER